MATYSETVVSLSTVTLSGATTYTVPAGKYARVTIYPIAVAQGFFNNLNYNGYCSLNGTAITEGVLAGGAGVGVIQASVLYLHSGDVLSALGGTTVLVRAQEFSNP